MFQQGVYSSNLPARRRDAVLVDHLSRKHSIRPVSSMV